MAWRAIGTADAILLKDVSAANLVALVAALALSLTVRWALRQAAVRYGLQEIDWWVVPLFLGLFGVAAALLSGHAAVPGLVMILAYAGFWLLTDRLIGRRPAPQPPGATHAPNTSMVLAFAISISVLIAVLGAFAWLLLIAGRPLGEVVTVVLATPVFSTFFIWKGIRDGGGGVTGPL